MSDFPKFVEFREEGPREGFQMESGNFSLKDRAALIDALSATGLKRIQVGSFVSPKAVPQMADTAELFQAIKRRPDVRYTALWLNEKGFHLARSVEYVDLEPNLLFYTSEKFSQSNNNCSCADMRSKQARWLDLYLDAGLRPDSAYVMTAFGCNMQGEIKLERVLDEFRFIIDLCAEKGCELPSLILADTMGWGNPQEMKRRIGAVRDLAPDARIGLHLHDTRGLGIANVYAAFEMGVDLFDASIAGLGGCPFASHGDHTASGNISTEDSVFLAHELGIETGIDLDLLIDAARLAEQIIDRPLTGRVMHSGSLSKYRA